MRTTKLLATSLQWGLVLWFLMVGARVALSSSVSPPTRSPEETLARLSERSQLIVSGTVVRLSTRYGPPFIKIPTSRLPILTEATIAPTTAFKGQLSETRPVNSVFAGCTPRLQGIKVVVPGGCIESDDICFTTDLYPSFQLGEQVLLFLKGSPDGKWILADPLYGKQGYQNGELRPLGLDEEVFKDVLRGKRPK